MSLLRIAIRDKINYMGVVAEVAEALNELKYNMVLCRRHCSKFIYR